MTSYDHYKDTLIRSLPRLLIISVGLAVIAYFLVQSRGVTYEVHYSYLVSLSEREATTSDYRFDGFYALQATDLFSATLERWTRTPEVIVAAYKEAGIALPTREARSLVRAVSTAKTAPQLVEVTVRHSEAEVAERLADGLQVVMERNVRQYHEEGIPALRFRAVATQRWTGISRISSGVVFLATLFAAFLLGVNFVLLRASLQNDEDRD